MTHFEYITVAVSMVLSLGVVRLLEALRHAFDPARRYAVVLLWIIAKLMNHVLFWWALWSYRDFADWNILDFTWILLFPGLLYMQVISLVTTTPQDIADWRTHFYSVRRWFFSANILLLLHSAITLSLVPAVASLYPVLAVQAVLLVINIVGVLSANPKLHLAIVLLALVIQGLGFGTMFFAFGPPVSN
jgi:hypothetical protein